MPIARSVTLAILLGAALAPGAAMAESQSSNSSSNCSNGRCTRVESLVIEDRQGRRGWVRHEGWRERDGRYGWGWAPQGRMPDRRLPRRGRDDDDDD